MYLLFVDHSGGPDNPTERHFVMGGSAVFERQIYWLERELAQIQSDYFPGVQEHIEFHASKIRRGDGAPWDGMQRAQREELLIRVYTVLADARDPGLCLFAQAIEKSAVVPDFATRMAKALRDKEQAENKLKTEALRGEEKAQAK